MTRPASCADSFSTPMTAYGSPDPGQPGVSTPHATANMDPVPLAPILALPIHHAANSAAAPTAATNQVLLHHDARRGGGGGWELAASGALVAVVLAAGGVDAPILADRIPCSHAGWSVASGGDVPVF